MSAADTRAAKQVIALAVRLERGRRAPAFLLLVDAVAFAAIDFAAPGKAAEMIGKAIEVLVDARERVDAAEAKRRPS
jgi:hypothetical protein